MMNEDTLNCLGGDFEGLENRDQQKKEDDENRKRKKKKEKKKMRSKETDDQSERDSSIEMDFSPDRKKKSKKHKDRTGAADDFEVEFVNETEMGETGMSDGCDEDTVKKKKKKKKKEKRNTKGTQYSYDASLEQGESQGNDNREASEIYAREKSEYEGKGAHNDSLEVQSESQEDDDGNLTENRKRKRKNKNKKVFDNDSVAAIDSNAEICNINDPGETSRTEFADVDDSFSVDADFTDDDYAVPFKRTPKKKSRKSQEEQDEPEDTDSEDLPAIQSLYDSSKYSNASLQWETSTGIPGASSKSLRKKWRPYEEMLYNFPVGKGIPESEIEAVGDEESFWKMTSEKMNDTDFTEEEIVDSINIRIDKIIDYYKRLEDGCLTKEERRQSKPVDFNGPYFPTPKDMKFFEMLDISITWPLSVVHEYSMTYRKRKEYCKMKMSENGIVWKTGAFTEKEEKSIMEHWIKFQEEYKFYDLRPLVSVRTQRIFHWDEGLQCIPFYYMNIDNRTKFVLYLLQGLPQRTVQHGLKKIQQMIAHIRDNTYKKTFTKTSGREIAEMKYILQMFGSNFDAVELLMGRYTRERYTGLFHTRIWLSNVKNLRYGPWTERELDRLERGVKEEFRIEKLDEAINMKLSWVNVLPYVRTRGVSAMRGKLLNLIMKQFRQEEGGHDPDKRLDSQDKVKLIKMVLDSGATQLSEVDFTKIAEEHFPNHHSLYLYKRLQVFLYATPSKCKSFNERLEFLYKEFRLACLNKHGIMKKSSTSSLHPDATMLEAEEVDPVDCDDEANMEEAISDCLERELIMFEENDDGDNV